MLFVYTYLVCTWFFVVIGTEVQGRLLSTTSSYFPTNCGTKDFQVLAYSSFLSGCEISYSSIRSRSLCACVRNSMFESFFFRLIHSSVPLPTSAPTLPKISIPRGRRCPFSSSDAGEPQFARSRGENRSWRIVAKLKPKSPGGGETETEQNLSARTTEWNGVRADGRAQSRRNQENHAFLGECK